jgi:hypothetical protein
MEEIWKDVPETDGRYEASTFGRIRFKDSGRFISYSNSTSHYDKCAINRKSIKVHRIIANTFIPKIEGKNEVNHKDFDRKNNRIDNLEWTSRRENHTHVAINNPNRSSKYVGVTKVSDKLYYAKISINNKKVHLGKFDNELDARDAYLNYLKEHNIENKYAHI